MARSADYYTGVGAGGGGASPLVSYYTGAEVDAEPPGVWRGELAERLGLVGDVRDVDLRTLLEHHRAPDGTPLGQRPAAYRTAEEIAERLRDGRELLPEEEARITRAAEARARRPVKGVDLTFSPVKSVTVAHTAAARAMHEATDRAESLRAGLARAVGESGDRLASDVFRADAEAARWRAVVRGIEAAVWTANESAMSYAREAMRSRAGRNGVRSVGVRALARASFFQLTARGAVDAGERTIDPQVHIHNVIPSKVECDDGRMRAIDTAHLRDIRRAISAVGDRVLMERLADLGLESQLRADEKARELVDIPAEVAELFSQRRGKISAAAERAEAEAVEMLGRSLTALERSRLQRQVVLKTRQKKDREVRMSVILEEWQADMVAELGTGLAPVAAAVRDAVRRGPAERLAVDAESVAAESIEALSSRVSTWTRADLMQEIDLRMPTLGVSTSEAVAALERVTDLALAGDGAVKVSAEDDSPEELQLRRPDRERYAAAATVAAEEALRRAARDRGAMTAGADEVAEWLDEHAPTAEADQRAAVLKLATSPSRLSVMVGPAGTGKSFTAGALAGAWSATTGGRVVGLATAETAARVLAEDGIRDSANIRRWLEAQRRIEAGRPGDGDDRWRLGGRDVVLVDEASMVSTEDLAAIRERVEAAGARMVLAGDAEQLQAVGAGGVLALVADAPTVHLSEVRRFAHQWEREASLRLRGGGEAAVSAVDALDVHDRLDGYAGPRQAREAAAAAVVRDMAAGRSSLVVAPTNAEAAEVALLAREELERRGLVGPAEGVLDRDGVPVGVGDVVMARSIDWGLGMINRERYRVTHVGGDGALRVVAGDGGERHVPASYAQTHLSLAYAATVHAAQGQTVDRGHLLLTTGSGDRRSVYVGVTRGREENRAHVALGVEPTRPPAATPLRQAESGEWVGVAIDEQRETASARQVLVDIVTRSDEAQDSQAAVVVVEREAEAAGRADVLVERREAVAELATRQRLEGWLDELASSGALDAVARQRASADEACDALSRRLRILETQGVEPGEALASAVRQGELASAHSVPQVIISRLPAVDHRADVVAVRGSDEVTSYSRELARRLDDRARALGEAAAHEAPEWAVLALGEVPEDDSEREDWTERAGRVALAREAMGWEETASALPPAPGLLLPERRAVWSRGWEALGYPPEALGEAMLPSGALRARLVAWERAQQWAPAHADEALRSELARAREAEQLGEDAPEAEREAWQARRELALARAAELDEVAATRTRWWEATSETRARAERASAELERRGEDTRPDPVSTSDFVEAEAEAREVDEAEREITTRDVVEAEEMALGGPEAATDGRVEAGPPSGGMEAAGAAQRALTGAWQRLTAGVGDDAVRAAREAARAADALIAERVSADTAAADILRDEDVAAAGQRRRSLAELDAARRDGQAAREAGRSLPQRSR